MMDHFQTDGARRAKLFAQYGLGPDDEVLVNYDVLIDLAPHPRNPK